MEPLTIQQDGYILTSDKQLMDVAAIYEWLSQHSYWAKGIPEDVFKASFEHSFTVGILAGGRQLAYARFITDYATFAYLADVFVIPEYRGKGYSKQLLQFMLQQPWIGGLRRIMLATLDAHELYRQFGFNAVAVPERLMDRVGVTSYSVV